MKIWKKQKNLWSQWHILLAHRNHSFHLFRKLTTQPARAHDTIRHQWWVDQTVRGVRLCNFPKIYIYWKAYSKALHRFFFISSVFWHWDYWILTYQFDFYMNSVRWSFYGRSHYTLSLIRELHIVILWAAVIRRLISGTGNGKCLGCCYSSRMSHADSEMGKKGNYFRSGRWWDWAQWGSRPKH